MEKVREAVCKLLHGPCEPFHHDWVYCGGWYCVCLKCYEILELVCV